MWETASDRRRRQENTPRQDAVTRSTTQDASNDAVYPVDIRVKPGARPQPKKSSRRRTTCTTAATKDEPQTKINNPTSLHESLSKLSILPTNTQLHYRTKTAKKENRDFTKLSLNREEIYKKLYDFESGLVSGRALVLVIIDTLFYRDFMPGKHWDIDSAVVSELSNLNSSNSISNGGEDVQTFSAEKEATWDWKDIYSVASAKAIIKIISNKSSGERHVYVDEYSYYVAG